MFVAPDLDLVSRVLGEEPPVTLVHVERTQRAIFSESPFAHRDHLALLGLLLGGVGDDDSTLGLLLFLDASHQDSVVQRSHLHGSILPSVASARRSSRTLPSESM